MEDIQSREVTFPSPEGSTPAYLALPTGEGEYPGLVVIQEWWGLVPHIREVTERFASEGFVALAPDLYHGEKAEEPDEARKLAMHLDRNRAVEEIQAAIQYLKGRTNGKVGVVGWCMGGYLTLATAAESDQLDAAVVFYGSPREAGLAENIQVPLLGLYGAQDHGIPVDLVRQFEQELKANNVEHQIHVYPDAGHAFFNDTRPQAYHEAAARDAWQRTLDWFNRNLHK